MSPCRISWRSVKRLRRYGVFPNFEDGGRRHVGFLNFFKILTVGTLKRVKLRHHAKCRSERSNQCGDMVIFQDGGLHHLGFINFHNFNCRNAQAVHTALSCQISWRSVKLSRRYADFSIFQTWRLSAILDL